MKFLLPLLLFFAVRTSAQWNLIHTFPAGSGTGTEPPYSLDYTTDSAIFIGTHSNFLYSKNAGTSFNSMTTFAITPPNTGYASGHEFRAVSFVNKDTGLVAGDINNSGYDGLVQYGTGLFTNWNVKSPLDPTASFEIIEKVKMFPGKRAYALDKVGNLYKSTNGITWQLKNSLSIFTLDVLDMCFTDSLHGFFFTDIGNYKTTDGGTSFQPLGALPAGTQIIVKASFINPLLGYVIANNNTGESKVLRTADGGNTWSSILPQAETFFSGFNDISFPSPDTGFVSAGHEVLATYDGGTSWYRQHFSTSYDLLNMEFISSAKGVLTATDYVNLQVYKYNGANPAQAPYAPFDFTLGYCCDGQICNVHNYGLPSWTYEWKINNVVFSTAHTPSNLMLPANGYNTVTLVAINGAYRDSLNLTVMNATSVPPGTITYGLVDTAICINSQLNGYFTNTNMQYSYYVTNASGTQITSPAQGSGSNVGFTTPVLHAADTVLNLIGQSPYPTCPGNTLTASMHVNFYPLLPDTLLKVLSDSICPGDSATIIFGPLKTNTSYWISGSAYQNGPPLDSFNDLDSTYNVYTVALSSQSENFYYAIMDYDTHCTLSQSSTTTIIVDSIRAMLKGPAACFAGDTVTLLNSSVGVQFNWAYSSGTALLSNNNQVLQVKANNPGEQDYIYMNVTNNSGCKDSTLYRIDVYEPMQTGGGTLCFKDTTFLLEDIAENNRLWYTQMNNHIKLHVDLNQNYYVTRNVFYGNPNAFQSDLYGAIGFEIAKYDKNGNLKWKVGPNIAASSIGPNNDYVSTTISTVTSDPYGNVYFGGNFRGYILRIGSLGKLFPFTNGVFTNGYLAKLDSNGVCKWIMPMFEASNIPGFTPASIGNLEYESQNSIYFNVGGVEQINYPPFTNINYTGGNHYLVKINAAGNHIRSNATHRDTAYVGYSFLNSSVPNGAEAYAVDHKTLKYKGRIINVNVTTKPVVTLANGQTISSAGSPCYAYVVVTDTMGAILSAFKPMSLYGADLHAPGLQWEHVPQIAVDKDGYFYFSWGLPTLSSKWYQAHGYSEVRDTILLSDGTIIDALNQESVLEKFDLNGNLQWHTTHNFFNTNSLVANNDGNIYGLGQAFDYAGLQSTDGHDQLMRFVDTCMHALLYSYDAAGHLRWGKAFQTSKFEYPKELCKKDTCNTDLYFLLAFNGAASFAGNSVPLTSHYTLFKFDPAGNCSTVDCGNIPVMVPEITSSASSELFEVFPNPGSGTFTLRPLRNLAGQPMRIMVYDAMGRLIRTITNDGMKESLFDLDGMANGIYSVVAQYGTVIQTKKLILAR